MKQKRERRTCRVANTSKGVYFLFKKVAQQGSRDRQGHGESAALGISKQTSHVYSRRHTSTFTVCTYKPPARRRSTASLHALINHTETEAQFQALLVLIDTNLSEKIDMFKVSSSSFNDMRFCVNT